MYKKYCLFLCIAILTSFDVFGAQLVGSEVLLCSNGYTTDGTTCTSYTAGICESGNYQIATDMTAFVAPDTGTIKCSTAGYKESEIPSEMSIVYQGLLVGSETLLCSNGYTTDGTTCTTYSAGICESGNYQIATGMSAFVAPDAGTSKCSVAGYKSSELPSITSVIYQGLVVGSETLLCSNGYTADGSVGHS